MVAEFERGAIWLSQRNGRISSKWRSAFSRSHIGRLLIITPEIPRFVGYLAPLGSHFGFCAASWSSRYTRVPTCACCQRLKRCSGS